ncbi:unnamed protein product [Calypogeia fissa]
MEAAKGKRFRSSGGGGRTPTSWTEYFPGEPYSDLDRRVLLFEALTRSLQSPKGQQLLSQVNLEGSKYSLLADVENLKQASVLPEVFFLALAEKPQDAVSCLGAAAYEMLFCSNKSYVDPRRIAVRIFNYPESMLALKHLKAATIDRLISVRGTVVRMSPLKPLVTSMSFSCAKCRDVGEQRFKDGKFSPPTKCVSEGCRSKSFLPDRKSAKLTDFQKIRIQEILSPNEHEDGRMPRTVECELSEDLVDACVTADVVTVCGFVKVINTDIDSGGGKAKSKNDGLLYLYIEAISIVNSKNTDKEGQVESNELRAPGPPNALTFTTRDLGFIIAFAEETRSDLFRTILHSICPSIYGHELVKAGITLALFGGVQQHLADDNKVPVRGDIHVLIVGDPGLGKSQLLKAASAVAGRGIYVCGNTTTTAGLTVAVVKDALTGDYVFEAGAMVLADRGMCCIDEFDKLSAEHQALLESMEQQSVSVAKAGLVASLSARTSVLAAANPVGGRYNRAKTVNENLKMSAALLSRFDLVFILLDKPDEAMDQRLSEHILALHAGSVERQHAAQRAFLEPSGSTRYRRANDLSLKTRLKLDRHADRDFEPLPPQLLRKYIAYARQYVFPRLSDEASAVLKEFYLQLRKNAGADGTPITARQLESLVRLAEARAKLELREEITKQDALDVVEIMKESLVDKFIDEHGCLDFGRSGGLSHQKEAKRFLNALQQRADLRQDALITTAELYSIADEIELKVKNLEAFIENLNNAGYLLKKGHTKFQVQSSSYSGTQRQRHVI